MSYGIVLSKDVMVTMRDGIRLAFDIYRPAATATSSTGGFPTIVLPDAVRQDRQARTPRSPTSSSRRATPSC